MRGWDYELGERQRTTLTLEHAHANRWGDLFAWIDGVKPDGEDFSYYGEISPRLSFLKMKGTERRTGLVKDVLLSTTFEKTKDQGPQYLYGLGLDLNLGSFRFFKLNAYIHDSTELDGETWQITAAWNRSFTVAGVELLCEGFADFQGSEGASSANQLIAPRLLFDFSRKLGQKNNSFLIGVEHQYWHNKFGRKGVTESVPQLQLKWNY